MTSKELIWTLNVYRNIYTKRFISFITKYYPFSQRFDNYLDHYKHRAVRQMQAKMLGNFLMHPISIDKDENFYYLFYKKTNYLQLDPVKEVLKNENAYVSEYSDEVIKILIPRN